jgi:membrane protease YdiL (CAAX protease family)
MAEVRMSDEPLVGTRSGPRYVAVILFVSAWMACGWLFRLDANAYLLLGIPLTVLFQWLVRRRPIRALWVREAPHFRLGWKGVVIAVALSLVPLASLAGSAVEREWVGCLFDLCSVAGAVGAAYALRHFRREHLRPLAWCLLITLALDVVQWSLFLGFGLVEMRPAEGGVLGRIGVGVLSLLQYMAVVFVMEEVTFRMLDSHLHDSDRGRGFLSALFISAVWGLWHLPIGEELTWQGTGLLLYVHVPYGVCLSLFWRKTGNLVVPGLCHALGDAIRNALMAGG